MCNTPKTLHMFELEAHERYCQVCNAENVDYEKHCLLLCPAFTDERQKLFHTVSTLYNGFNDMSNNEKFIFLMSKPNVYRLIAKTCHIMLQKRRQNVFNN